MKKMAAVQDQAGSDPPPLVPVRVLRGCQAWPQLKAAVSATSATFVVAPSS